MFSDTFFPQINGVTTTIDMWKKRLEERGHKVLVFYPESKYHPKKGEVPLPSASLPFYKTYRIGLPYKDVPAIKNFDIIHTHTQFSIGAFGAYIGRKFGIPRVTTFHTPLQEYIEYMFKNRILREPFFHFYNFWEKNYLGGADLLTAPTERIRNSLERRLKKDVILLSNGVDVRFFKKGGEKEFRKKYDLESKKIIGFCGRHSYEKHLEDLIEIGDYFDGEIIILGSGPASEYYKKLSKGKRNVKFLGFIGKEDLPKFYSIIDFFVFPSTAETQGLVALEANACGTPVIGARAMALKETIVSGLNGYLYEPGNIQDILDKLEKGYKNKKGLEKNCRKFAEKHSVDKTVDRLEELYSNLKMKNTKKYDLIYFPLKILAKMIYKFSRI